jgi:hypothetical protein
MARSLTLEKNKTRIAFRNDRKCCVHTEGIKNAKEDQTMMCITESVVIIRCMQDPRWNSLEISTGKQDNRLRQYVAQPFCSSETFSALESETIRSVSHLNIESAKVLMQGVVCPPRKNRCVQSPKS